MHCEDLVLGRISSGRASRPNGFTTPWRSLPWSIVQGMEEGHYRIDHAAGSDILGPGTVWFVPPGCRHRQGVHGGGRVLTVHLQFTVSLHGAIDPCAGLGAPRILPGAMHGALGRALLAAARPPTGGGLAEAARQLSLLARLVSELGRAVPGLDGAPAVGLLAPAMRFAEANLHLPLTRTELAARVGLAASRFHALFLAATARPPMAWVRERRLARAAALLVGSDLALDAIAERCGFCDATHLCRLFRRAHALSPIAFREQGRA